MKHALIPLLGLFALVSVSTVTFASPDTATPATRSREIQSLDDGWRFHLGEAPDAVFLSFNDHSWRQVDLPHDYVIEGTFSEKNPYPCVEVLRPDWFWMHAFLPVRCRGDVEAQHVEHRACHFLVHRVVFHHERPTTRAGRRQHTDSRAQRRVDRGRRHYEIGGL